MMKVKYNKILSAINIKLILSGLFLLVHIVGQSSHIVGGDISYKRLSYDPVTKKGRFLITMNVRRDYCSADSLTEFDDPAEVGIYRDGILFMPIDMALQKVDTLNEYIQSDCGFDGPQVCYHTTTYLKIVELPFTNSVYTIVYQRCCRNRTILNIVNPLETGDTFFTEITSKAFLEGNSSPVFKSWPPIYICINKPINFLNSATDSDGDSLVYRLCTPYLGRSIKGTSPGPKGLPTGPPPYQNLTWLPPYSLDNLLGGVPMTINSKTGLIEGIPNSVGQFVAGLCIEEWRKGVKIGEITRDFQFNVRECSQPPTAIFTAPSNLCNETKVVFENNSLAANAFEWNFNFPSTDPSFKSKEKNPTFTFPGNGTYQVKLTVIRNSDNCRDEEVKTIKITDLPYNADFEYEIKACNPDGTISAILTDKSSTTDPGAISKKWNWELTQDGKTKTVTTNPAEFIINPADFSVKLDVEASNACKGSVSRNVDFDSKIFESNFDIVLDGCDPNNDLQILLVDSSQLLNDNYVVTERKWLVSYAGNPPVQLFGNNVVATVPRTNFTVSLDVNTDKNCRNTLSKDFDINTVIPTIDFNYSLSGCDSENNATISMIENSNDTVAYSAVSAYAWTFKDQNLTGKNIEYVTTLRDSFVSKLTLTFADNCTSEVSKPISLNQLRPKVDFSYITAECPDDNNVTLVFKYEDKDNKGLSNNGINWKIGNISDVNPYNSTPVTVTVPKDSTIYGSINAEFKNGCKDTISREFIPGPYATLKIIEDSLVLCPNEVKHLIANGNPKFDYTWTPNTNLNLDNPYDPILTAKNDQTYEVIVSDGLCTVKGKVNVEVLESLNIAIDGEKNTCDGSVFLVASGGFGAGTYTWYTDTLLTQKVFEGDTLKTSFNITQQKYFVTFKSQKACNASPASIKVVNQTPRFDIVSPYKLCYGDTIPTNNVFNTIPGHNNTIKWDANPHIISNGNTLKPVVGTINPSEKAFTLYFTALNQYGCDHRDSLQFEVIPNPIVKLNHDVTDCNDFEVCFKFNNASSTQLFGIPKWTFGDGKTAPGVENVEICNKYPKAGTYFVVLSNLSPLCPFKDVIDTIVLNDQFPVFDNDNKEDCINSDFTLTLPDKAKGRDFVWQDTKGNVISTLPNPKVDIKSDTSFILNVKDDNGCAFNDTFSVKAFVFDTKLKVDDVVCTYGIYPITTAVNAGVNFTYQWTPANAIVSGGNTGNPTVDVAKATKYTVKFTNADLGCIKEESVEFQTFKFDHKKNEPDVYCLNQNAQPSITVLPALTYQYEWSPASQIVSGGNTASPTVNVTGNGSIYVKVTNPDLGCVLRDTFKITTSQLVIGVSAEPSGEVTKGQTVVISIIDPKPKYTYTWSNGFVGTTQSVKIDEDITFTVTATDENGCEGNDRVDFTIRPPKCAQDVFIPTAFSPNADGTNDTLLVRSAYIQEMELVIYNRWGQEVFSTKDQNIGWDGTLLGEALAPDVYAYWLKAKCGEGDEIVKRGNISLLR